MNSKKIKDKYIMLTCNKIAIKKQIKKTHDDNVLFNVCQYNNISPMYSNPIVSSMY